MMSVYLRAGSNAASKGLWKSGRSFLTLCATPTQHKTEETQGSLNTAKTHKCSAENTVQHKMNSSTCASQRMLRLKLNELDREYRTLQEMILKPTLRASMLAASVDRSGTIGPLKGRDLWSSKTNIQKGSGTQGAGKSVVGLSIYYKFGEC